MSLNEGDGAIVLLACGGILLVTARIVGVRRVPWGLLIAVALALLAALRTLGVISAAVATDARRASRGGTSQRNLF